MAYRTGTQWCIEREQSWLQMRYRKAADLAGIVAGKQHFLITGKHRCHAVCQRKSCLNRVMNTGFGIIVLDDAVHNDINAVALVLLQFNVFFQHADFTIHPHTHIAILQQLGKGILEGTLLLFDNRCHDSQSGTLRQGHDGIHHLGNGLTGNRNMMMRTVRHAASCI